MKFSIVVIHVGFNQSSYTVNEYVGTLSPVLSLDRPSPCGITVFAELVDDTATGKLCTLIMQVFSRKDTVKGLFASSYILYL